MNVSQFIVGCVNQIREAAKQSGAFPDPSVEIDLSTDEQGNLVLPVEGHAHIKTRLTLIPEGMK